MQVLGREMKPRTDQGGCLRHISARPPAFLPPQPHAKNDLLRRHILCKVRHGDGYLQFRNGFQADKLNFMKMIGSNIMPNRDQAMIGLGQQPGRRVGWGCFHSISDAIKERLCVSIFVSSLKTYIAAKLFYTLRTWCISEFKVSTAGEKISATEDLQREFSG
jgi:hypothetical protein